MIKTSAFSLLALTLLAASPAAGAPRETKYDVTFEAQKVESWKFDEHVSRDCIVDGAEGRCNHDSVGSGSTRIVLRTPTPQRVSVITGAGGTQPMITASIDGGIPLKGSHRVGGSYTETYSGPWKAANPDIAAPTSGCGNHTLKVDVALGWKGRNQLAPVMLVDELRECPTGPISGFDYPEAPSVDAAVAQIGETKFGRTRQFTVRGTKTWAGTIDPINRTTPDDLMTRFGQSEVRWTWEATFRMVSKKRKRRR